MYSCSRMGQRNFLIVKFVIIIMLYKLVSETMIQGSLLNMKI